MAEEEKVVVEEKPKKKKRQKDKLIAEFKMFITKGNAFSLAIGVVIGAAFGAVVTGIVGVFTGFFSWFIPGSISSLVYVLPPIYESQQGVHGLPQWFYSNELQNYVSETVTDKMITSNYRLVGGKWIVNGAAYIDFGVLINALISFALVAIVLFFIVKGMAAADGKRKEINDMLREEYYKKHPDERPEPVEEGKPQPTDNELLTEIRDLLKEKNNKK